MSRLFKPKLEPIESAYPWRDTRPGPKAMVNGGYTPVLRRGNGKKPDNMVTGLSMEPPKKERSTV